MQSQAAEQVCDLGVNTCECIAERRDEINIVGHPLALKVRSRKAKSIKVVRRAIVQHWYRNGIVTDEWSLVNPPTMQFYPADFNCNTVATVLNAATGPGLYASDGTYDSDLISWNWQSTSPNEAASYYPP